MPCTHSRNEPAAVAASKMAQPASTGPEGAGGASGGTLSFLVVVCISIVTPGA